MAINNSFFSKRDTASVLTRTPAALGVPASAVTAVQAVPAASPSTSCPAVAENHSQGSKLTVGPNIKLKGVEITDCDTLVVEGTVEATMDSRVMHIAQQGAFHGAAEIDIAEIHGHFTGTLTVRDKLFICSTGKVSGKIRYGKLVIAEGGQLSGEIDVAGATMHSNAPKALAAKSDMLAA